MTCSAGSDNLVYDSVYLRGVMYFFEGKGKNRKEGRKEGRGGEGKNKYIIDG